MIKQNSLVAQVQDFFCRNDENIHEVRPFYWLLMLVLAVMYAWTLAYTPILQTPLRLVLFTGLMLVHAGLHWISPYLTTRRRWLVPYFVIQGALAFVINLLAANQGITLGLYLGLAGEAVGILEDLRRSIIPVAVFLALSAINFVLIWGLPVLPWWLLATAPMTFFVIVYVTMFVRQAQARERAQKLLRELETAHRQLSEYAARVEELTLQNERQRMARELHDTLAQGLAGLILQLEALETHLDQGNHQKAARIASQAQDRARAALSDARRAIDDLRARPAPADSLADAIQEEARRFSSATGVPCTLDLPPALCLPKSVAETVLRCISEGLTNIARHARASQASVSIALHDSTAQIIVRDNGVGFDLSVATKQAGHYGLLGLRERARLAGGTLEIESARGAGTTLVLRLPAPEENSKQ